MNGQPLNTLEDCLKNSNIKVVKDECEGTKLVETTLDNMSVLHKIERDILKIADKANDEGIQALMSDFISEQAKTMAMLNSVLE